MRMRRSKLPQAKRWYLFVSLRASKRAISHEIDAELFHSQSSVRSRARGRGPYACSTRCSPAFLALARSLTPCSFRNQNGHFEDGLLNGKIYLNCKGLLSSGKNCRTGNFGSRTRTLYISFYTS